MNYFMITIAILYFGAMVVEATKHNDPLAFAYGGLVIVSLAMAFVK